MRLNVFRGSARFFSRTLAVAAPAAPFVLIAAGLLGGARDSSALPALPGSNAPPAAPTAAAPSALPLEALRRGIVAVEQGGRTLGYGSVLSGDGRVLTALSVMGNLEQADLRYADGSVVRARIGHRDKIWDLALLVPLSGRWLEGLVASEIDPANAELRAFTTNRGRPAPAAVALKGRTEARARDGEPIQNALELDFKGAVGVPGAPIVDATGSVVGILAHACRAGDGGPCAAFIVGVPVFALRGFLVSTPLNAVAPAPWLGIGGAPATAGNVQGVRVMAVAPASPAERAGLKTNADSSRTDLIAAVDGQPVENPEQLAEVISKHAVGQTVKLLVFSGEKFREVAVVLRAAP